MSVLINDPIIAAVWTDIHTEYERSCRLHPFYPPDQLRRTAITVEEGLEALTEMSNRLECLMKAGLDATRATMPPPSDQELRLREEKLKAEVVQLAAMCVKHLIALRCEAAQARVGEY